MTVDWFLIDAPHVVAAEFQAWEAAKAHHRAVFLRCIDAQDSAERAALDAEGQAAKIEADRLEQIAREAWKRQR
ncbi:hypothetical protein AFAE65S_00113 [Alcaligenes phenolicus]